MPDFEKVAKKCKGKVIEMANIYKISALAVNRYAALLGYKTTVNKKKFSFILEQQQLNNV